MINKVLHLTISLIIFVGLCYGYSYLVHQPEEWWSPPTLVFSIFGILGSGFYSWFLVVEWESL